MTKFLQAAPKHLENAVKHSQSTLTPFRHTWYGIEVIWASLSYLCVRVSVCVCAYVHMCGTWLVCHWGHSGYFGLVIMCVCVRARVYMFCTYLVCHMSIRSGWFGLVMCVCVCLVRTWYVIEVVGASFDHGICQCDLDSAGPIHLWNDQI
jgi:hypothetical protein